MIKVSSPIARKGKLKTSASETWVHRICGHGKEVASQFKQQSFKTSKDKAYPSHKHGQIARLKLYPPASREKQALALARAVHGTAGAHRHREDTGQLMARPQGLDTHTRTETRSPQTAELSLYFY